MNIINLRLRRYLFLSSLLFLYCIISYTRWTPQQNEEKLTEGIMIFLISFIRYSCRVGHFWVFTDSHVDVLYQSDSNAAFDCHNTSLNNITKIIRKFGQLNCDIPHELLYSAFSAARRIDSKVDFVIWLGYIFIFNKFYPYNYTSEMQSVVTIPIKIQPYLFT